MFRRFLHAYKIHSRTLKPMYWYAKNDNEFKRIIRYISKHSFVPVIVYHPYRLSFTTFCDADDELYDEMMKEYE